MRKNRGPCDGYSVEKGHGGMKRNRHDQTMSPIPGTPLMSPVDNPNNTLRRRDGTPLPASSRNAQRDKEFSDAMGKSKQKYNAKQKAARRKELGQTIGKAGADMAGQAKADQERFSREHDAAVQAGSQTMQANRQGRPGRAQDIIKKRRV